MFGALLATGVTSVLAPGVGGFVVQCGEKRRRYLDSKIN
jgi:hypothetical protein